LLAAGERLQVDAGVDAARGAAALDGGDVGVEAQRELADRGLLVQRRDARQRAERLARVVGAREQQLAELDDPAASEPGEVDDATERVERLRGADVRGG